MATGTYAKFDDSHYKYGGVSRAYMIGKIGFIVKDFAERIQKRIKASMATAKHGRVYTKPGGGIHVASAPGEPPAIWSGKLRDSIDIRYSMGGLVAEIGVLDSSNPPYAHRLEAGFKVAARPYIKPVADTLDKEFVIAIRAAVL